MSSHTEMPCMVCRREGIGRLWTSDKSVCVCRDCLSLNEDPKVSGEYYPMPCEECKCVMEWGGTNTGKHGELLCDNCESEQSDTEVDSDEENIVFECAYCGFAVERDSEEHDHSMMDPLTEEWFCKRCTGQVHVDCECCGDYTHPNEINKCEECELKLCDGCLDDAKKREDNKIICGNCEDLPKYKYCGGVAHPKELYESVRDFMIEKHGITDTEFQHLLETTDCEY